MLSGPQSNDVLPSKLFKSHTHTRAHTQFQMDSSFLMSLNWKTRKTATEFQISIWQSRQEIRGREDCGRFNNFVWMLILERIVEEFTFSMIVFVFVCIVVFLWMQKNRNKMMYNYKRCPRFCWMQLTKSSFQLAIAL